MHRCSLGCCPCVPVERGSAPRLAVQAGPDRKARRARTLHCSRGTPNVLTEKQWGQQAAVRGRQRPQSTPGNNYPHSRTTANLLKSTLADWLPGRRAGTRWRDRTGRGRAGPGRVGRRDVGGLIRSQPDWMAFRSVGRLATAIMFILLLPKQLTCESLLL